MPMLRIRSRFERRRGVAAVEFAAILPLMLTLLVGIWEVGRMVEIQQVLTNAAREGARQAATGQYTNAQVQTIVTQYLTVAGLPTTNVVVNVSDLTTPANDVSQAIYLDNIQVKVTIPYKDASWSLTSMFTSNATNLSSTVQWMTIVDKPYPSAPQPPVG
jgi:Flp pilus assembly protein TadG